MISRSKHILLPAALCVLVSLCGFMLAGCAGARSSVLFESSGRHIGLIALSDCARDGVLPAPESAAWFRFDPAAAGIAEKKAATSLKCLEVVVRPEGGDSFSSGPVTLSLAFVHLADLDIRKALVNKPAARAMSVVRDASGSLRLSMVIPPGGEVCGFAVGIKTSAAGDGKKTSAAGKSQSAKKASAESKTSTETAASARIVSAVIRDAETGWQFGEKDFFAGFGSEGGILSVRSAADFPVALPAGSNITITFPQGGAGSQGPIAAQKKINFATGSHEFGFRKSSRPAAINVPSFLAADGASTLRAVSGGGDLAGVLVSWNRPFALSRPAEPESPILADPHMLIEWPEFAWRRKDREVFAWDRFPNVLIFDTADYAVQDRYFKRLAFFVEKKGWRGRLWTNGQIANQHAYYAHDYRADSLAEFFTRAASEKFKLNDEESELRSILVSAGVIRKDGSGFAAGTGAVLSISRESEGYLRYLFMAHEGYHGIYFTDPDFRAEVSRVFDSMDRRAIDYLQSYFTVVESLGYDTSDPYLMENELMAYLMQQPLDRVGPYFAGNISERYMRHGGKPRLNDWVVSTNGAEFTRAAAELNEYAYSRWGLAGGRVGLYWSDR